MKYLFSAALLFSAAGLIPAATLFYTARGTSSGSATNTLSLGGGNLVFDNLPSTSITVPGNLSFGAVDSTGITSSTSIPAGEMFTLTINETAPDSGKFINTVTIQGTIRSTGSTVNLFSDEDVLYRGHDLPHSRGSGVGDPDCRTQRQQRYYDGSGHRVTGARASVYGAWPAASCSV